MGGRLLIRADASRQIGTGHVMRCLALADAWMKRGGQVTLLSHCPADALRRRMEASGAATVWLESAHPHADDLAATLNLVAASPTADFELPWLVLDGEHFDAAYQCAVRQAGCRLLIVDDMNHLPHYHADAILNQNLGAEHQDYARDTHTLLLLGSRFAMLRSEFAPWQSWPRRIEPLARRILVTLGGADPPNATATVLAALAQLDTVGLQIRSVVGAANPRLPALRDQARRMGKHVELLADVQNMPELIAWADLAISAAGCTCWELALMGLPAALLVLADNQAAVADQLDRAGAAVALGWAGQVKPTAIAATISQLCRDRAWRQSLSNAARQVIDGQGAARVAAILAATTAPGLPAGAVRPAVAEDCLPLWRLTNDPLVRQMSLNTQSIALEEHIEWFQWELAHHGTRIWVFDVAGLVAGMVRYDHRQPGVAEISLAIIPALRCRGLGTRMVAETLGPAASQLNVGCVRAVIRRENAVSAHTFTKLGFVHAATRPVREQDCVIYEYPGAAN